MIFKRPDTPAILIVIAFSFGSFCFASYAFYQLQEIIKWQQSRVDVPKEIKQTMSDIKELKEEVVPRNEHIKWRNEFFELNPELVRP